MGKKIKYGISGLLTVFILLLLAAILLPRFIDTHLLQAQLIAAAQEATGRVITIDGPVKWSLLPQVSLQAQQITVANSTEFTDASPLATIKQLKLSVKILPLILSQTVVLDQLELTGVELNLLTSAQGRVNWQNLLAHSPLDHSVASHIKPAAKKTSGGLALNFSINTFVVQDSTIIWDDQAKKHYYKFIDLDVSSHAFSLAHPFPLMISTTIEHPSTNRVITLQALAEANLDPAKDNYLLTNLKIDGAVQEKLAATTENFRLEIAELQVDSKNKQLALSTILFDGFGTHASGELYVQPNSQYPRMLGDFNFDQLLLGKLLMTDINIPVKIARDHYDLAPITGSLYGGQLTANITINLAEAVPRWQINYQLVDLQMQALFNSLLNYNDFSGDGQIRGQLQGTGLDHDSMVSSLSGPVHITLCNGNLQGIDLNYWQQVGQKLLQGDKSTRQLIDHRSTPVIDLHGSFNFQDGVGTTDDLQLYNNLLFVHGSGQVDIKRKYIHMTLHVSQNQNGQATGTTIPLILYGNFDNIKVRPDARKIATIAAKLLQDQVGEEVTQALSKKIPSELAQPLNDAVKKLLQQ